MASAWCRYCCTRHGPDDACPGELLATESTLAVGTPLAMELEIEGCRIPLRGVVAWKRDRALTGRPVGMGVDLMDPPSLFKSFVRDMP